MRTRTIAAATLFALAGTAHAQLAEWDNSAGGLWTDATNWDPMVVPNAGSFTASIALPGTYDVFLSSSRTVGSLSLTNPNASVTIEFADSLSVDTGIVNNGEIVINNNGANASTTMFLRAVSTPITGTGSIRLNGFSTRSRLLTTTNAGVMHGSGHTIHGFGIIEADMQNDGLIDADVASQTLFVSNQPITNNATMRASNSGILDMNAFTLTQGTSGMVAADGGSVLMGGVTLIGGTLDTLNAGSFLVNAPSSFDSVTVEGDLSIEFSDRVDVTNALTNNATLTINNNGANAQTTLNFDGDATLQGTGEVRLNGFSTRSRLISNIGTLTHQAPHSIRGFGRIEGFIDNNSLIDADVPAQTLFLSDATMNNASTLRASNTGILDINTSTIDQSGGGMIIADGGTVLYGGVSITDGVVDTVNGGVSFIDASSSFENVMLLGDVTLEVSDTLTISNGLENNATLLINNTTGNAVTALSFADSSTLSGDGEVVLNGFQNRSRIQTDAGQIMTHAFPHVIRGYGQIIADMVNNSLISADTLNQTLFFDDPTIDNNSVIQSIGGSIVDFNGATVNNQTGVIRADAGTVRIGTTTINGGILESLNAGTLFVDGFASFDSVTINGDLEIEISDTVAVTNGLTNNAALTVNNTTGAAATSLRFDDDSTLGGIGTVTLNGFSNRARLFGLDDTITATQASTHTIEGEGQIAVALINNGTIAPGFPGVTPIREMLATEDITNTDSASYIVEVQGDNNSDLLDSSAAYHADGTLTVELINGFDPADYWNTSIVQADGGITGRFDTIVASEPIDTRLTIRARYLPDEIRVGAVCKPDIDFNGLVNFFDITAFIALFNAEDPDADIAAPFGAWNFFDIAAYIGQFNAGCP